jgi:hypothetical protein
MIVDDQGNVIIDDEILAPEELELVLDTMDAHSFSFLIDLRSNGICSRLLCRYNTYSILLTNQTNKNKLVSTIAKHKTVRG